MEGDLCEFLSVCLSDADTRQTSAELNDDSCLSATSPDGPPVADCCLFVWLLAAAHAIERFACHFGTRSHKPAGQTAADSDTKQ